MSHHQPADFTTPAFHEARAILALIGPDPDAPRHVADLLEAIGALCVYCDRPSRSGRMCDAHRKRHSRMVATIRANQTETLNRKAAA